MYGKIKAYILANQENLREAVLFGANLLGADLLGADLQWAKYCADSRMKTVFPDGFNPQEHGMIEVDIYGNPVEE